VDLKKDDNKIKIIEEARNLFIENQGIEGVNMHQIAKSANVGQATLYRKYTNLNDIAIDVAKEECLPLVEEINTFLENHEALSSLEKLSHVIQLFQDFLEEKTPWLCSLSKSITGYQPMQSFLYQSLRHTCTALFEDALKHKEIKNINIPFTTEALLSVLHDYAIHQNALGFDKKQILEGIYELFIENIKAP